MMTSLDHYLSGPYILNAAHEPILVTPDEARAWEYHPSFFHNRIVEHTDVTWNDEKVSIQTDFQVSPLPDFTRDVWCFFETMVFGGPLDDLAWQWPTWDEAVAGHQQIVRLVTHVHSFHERSRE